VPQLPAARLPKRPSSRPIYVRAWPHKGYRRRSRLNRMGSELPPRLACFLVSQAVDRGSPAPTRKSVAAQVFVVDPNAGHPPIQSSHLRNGKCAAFSAVPARQWPPRNRSRERSACVLVFDFSGLRPRRCRRTAQRRPRQARRAEGSSRTPSGERRAIVCVVHLPIQQRDCRSNSRDGRS
jgi:hypothetical protein